MENRAHALVAGLFVLALGLATAAAVWFFSGSRERTDTYVLETSRNVTGLNVEAQVLYHGIRAGKVVAIEPEATVPRLIRVTIAVDSRYRLSTATTAELGYQGITGLAYVQLEDRGGGKALLDAPGTLPPRITMKPTLLDALGDKAGDIVGQVAELSLRMNRMLDEKNAKNLSRTLENAATASDGLRQLPQLLASMRAALSDTNLKRLSGALQQVEATAGEAAPLAAEARDMVRSLTALSRRLDGVVEAAGGEVSRATLPQLSALIRELTANSRQLARVLDTLDNEPQALLFGKTARPGPGESGFSAPATQ